MHRSIKTLFIIGTFLLSNAALFAQASSEPSLKQITTHPDIDLSPRISPDGKWLAFVSRQTNNFDIWIRRVTGGRAIQITTHKADDFYPVWMPKNRAIVFVSQRSDALGDIWKINLREVKGTLLPKGEPIRLTSYLGLDGYPTVAPDGKKVAWVSDRTGREEIWFHNDNTGKTSQLTFKGGTHPCWSPDQRFIAFTSFRAGEASNGDIFMINLKGSPPTGQDTLMWDRREPPLWQVTIGSAMDGFPSWSPDAKKLVFLRHEFDTNDDSLLTPVDHGQIWRAEVRESSLPPDSLQNVSNPAFAPFFNPRMVSHAFAITSEAYGVSQPWYGADRWIYYVSNQSGNLDIWAIPEIGNIIRLDSAAAQLNFAIDKDPFPARLSRQGFATSYWNWNFKSTSFREKIFLWDRALYFQRVLDFHGMENSPSRQALYHLGVTYALLGLTDRALSYFDILLDSGPDRKIAAYTEIARLALLSKKSPSNSWEQILNGLQQIIQKYSDEGEPASAAQIALGDLYFQRDEPNNRAFAEYAQVLKKYPQQRDACAEAQLKIGDVFRKFADQSQIIAAYLAVVENFPEQRQYMVPARDRILDLLRRNIRNQDILIARYREIIGQYSRFALLAAAAQLRIGDALFNAKDYTAARQEYETILVQFPDLIDEVFAARLAIAQTFLKQAEYVRAFGLLENLQQQHSANRADLAETARQEYLKALLDSGEELKRSGDFDLAISRFRRAKEMDPNNVHAHRGYIECRYLMRNPGIAAVVSEYEGLVRDDPQNQVLIYAFGLALSYQATEKAEQTNNPALLDPALLNRSSATLARSLSFDYTFVPGYLTISYNYEMMEQFLESQRNKPKGIMRRFFETITAPVISVYHTLTFYEETKPPRYFERAIHELTKAIALNNEDEEPLMEANLALNLANNYYNLGEFGFQKAYEFYHIKLAYDSTFSDKERQALIYERMGHCAFVIEDVENGPKYITRAISLYRQMNDEWRVLLNTKRLALLYQVGEKHSIAIDYYQRAAEVENRNNMYTELMTSYRSIAYEYLQLGETADAIVFAQRALELIDSGKVDEIKAKPVHIKAGFLGLYLPIPYDLSKMGAKSSLQLTTNEERALIYSILGESYHREKDLKKAIEFANQKLDLYRKKDFTAEAAFLNNLGFLYYLRGENRLAWDHFLRSFELSQKYLLLQGVITNSANLARIVSNLQNTGGLVADEQQDASTSDLLDMHQIALQKIQIALKMIGDDQNLFVRARSQLKLLLAEMALLDPRNEPANDLSTQMRSQYELIQNAYRARIYLQENLQLSRVARLTREECNTEYLFGQVYAKVNEADNAYLHLLSARRLAIRNGYFDLLWRIDTLLGVLVEGMDKATKIRLTVQWDPFEFYAEAIEVLESFPGDLSRSNAIYARRETQAPYRHAIRYLATKNDLPGIVHIAEQMHNKLYLDIVRDENIVLGKERQKNYYGNARFLQSKINELQVTLLQLRNKVGVANSEIISMRRELEGFRSEYNTLLQKARDEVPELETLVRVNPISITKIQRLLRKDEALIYHIALPNQALLIRLSPASIDLRALPIQSTAFHQEIYRLMDDIQSSQANLSPGSNTQAFSSTFEELAGEHSRVILIPEIDLFTAPWSILLSSTKIPSVIVSSSLSAYYYAYQNRTIQGDQLYAVTNEALRTQLAQQGYNVIEPLPAGQDNSFPNQIASIGLADILHFSVQGDWNSIHPIRSRVGYRIPRSASAVFSAQDLFRLTLKSQLVGFYFTQPMIPQQSNEALLAWERAWNYAGVPTMLVSLWPGEPKWEQQFFTTFYSNQKRFPPGEAFTKTQQLMREQDAPIREWARFQLYGFGGMSADEEARYALEGFEQKVRKGHSAFDLEYWDDAIRAYEEALSMADLQGDTESTGLLQTRILESAIRGSLWAKAIEMQLQLLRQAESAGDISEIATAYQRLAFFYTQNNEFDKGVEAKARYTQLAERYELWEEEANSLRETGLIYERGNNYQKAVELFTLAHKKYRDIENAYGQAMCLKDLGRVHFLFLDDYATALEEQKQALAIFRTFPENSDLVDALHNIGLTYERMTLYKSSLAFQQEALETAIQLNNQILIGRSKQYLANLYWKMGDYQAALQNQDEAMTLFLQANDEKMLQVAYSTRGLIALSLGQHSEALGFELKALDLAVQRQDRADQATIHKNIGMIQRSQSEFRLALASFQQAARIDSTTRSKSGLATSLRNISLVQLDLNEPESARKNIALALQLSEQIGDRRNLAQCYLTSGQIELRQQKRSAARENFSLAADIAANFFIPEIAWRAYHYQAQSFEQDGDREKAIEAYYRAIDVIEIMRSQIKVEEFASGFVDDKLDVYGALVGLLTENKRPEEAFALVERAKGRSFLDMLANRNIRFKPQNAALVAEGDSLQTHLTRLQTELTFLRTKNDITTRAREAELESAIILIRRSYSDYLLRVRQSDPKLSEMISVQPWSLEQVQKTLPDSAAVLEYYHHGEQLYAWLITRNDFRLSRQAVSADNIGGHIFILRSNLERQLAIQAPAQILYQLLIKPFAEPLKNIRHIVFVPHGQLHYLPFGILQSENGQYLAQRHTLSLAPSATVLGFTLQQGEQFLTKDPGTFSVLAFGNPDLGDARMRLPFAEREVASLQRYFNAVTAFVETKATETQLKSQAIFPPLMLLSCHGVYDPQNPLLSALLLTADDANDGRLEAFEIFDLNLNAHLVAMSACETGLSTIRSGDEVIGLTRSFLYAGASSLMSSLWKVDDLATAVLVKRFFRAISEGKSRAKALQEAQTIVMQEINPYPSFWAGFMLTGDFR